MEGGRQEPHPFFTGEFNAQLNGFLIEAIKDIKNSPSIPTFENLKCSFKRVIRKAVQKGTPMKLPHHLLEAKHDVKFSSIFKNVLDRGVKSGMVSVIFQKKLGDETFDLAYSRTIRLGGETKITQFTESKMILLLMKELSFTHTQPSCEELTEDHYPTRFTLEYILNYIRLTCTIIPGPLELGNLNDTIEASLEHYSDGAREDLENDFENDTWGLSISNFHMKDEREQNSRRRVDFKFKDTNSRNHKDRSESSKHHDDQREARESRKNKHSSRRESNSRNNNESTDDDSIQKHRNSCQSTPGPSNDKNRSSDITKSEKNRSSCFSVSEPSKFKNNRSASDQQQSTSGQNHSSIRSTPEPSKPDKKGSSSQSTPVPSKSAIKGSSSPSKSDKTGSSSQSDPVPSKPDKKDSSSQSGLVPSKPDEKGSSSPSDPQTSQNEKNQGTSISVAETSKSKSQNDRSSSLSVPETSKFRSFVGDTKLNSTYEQQDLAVGSTKRKAVISSTETLRKRPKIGPKCYMEKLNRKKAVQSTEENVALKPSTPDVKEPEHRLETTGGAPNPVNVKVIAPHSGPRCTKKSTSSIREDLKEEFRKILKEFMAQKARKTEGTAVVYPLGKDEPLITESVKRNGNESSSNANVVSVENRQQESTSMEIIRTSDAVTQSGEKGSLTTLEEVNEASSSKVITTGIENSNGLYAQNSVGSSGAYISTIEVIDISSDEEGDSNLRSIPTETGSAPTMVSQAVDSDNKSHAQSHVLETASAAVERNVVNEKFQNNEGGRNDNQGTFNTESGFFNVRKVSSDRNESNPFKNIVPQLPSNVNLPAKHSEDGRESDCGHYECFNVTSCFLLGGKIRIKSILRMEDGLYFCTTCRLVMKEANVENHKKTCTPDPEVAIVLRDNQAMSVLKSQGVKLVRN